AAAAAGARRPPPARRWGGWSSRRTGLAARRRRARARNGRRAPRRAAVPRSRGGGTGTADRWSQEVKANAECGMRNAESKSDSPFRIPNSTFRITRASPDPDRPPLPAPVPPARAPRDRWPAPPLGPAPGPARHLRHQLERPLPGPEIGQVQPGVRVHHADDRHVRKVQSLGDHLGAEQDVELAVGHALEYPMMRPLGAGGVQVHARDASSRKAKGYEMLQLLGAKAAHALDFLTAHAARGRDRLLVAAVVAA